jgi:hypothetical protein
MASESAPRVGGLDVASGSGSSDGHAAAKLLPDKIATFSFSSPALVSLIPAAAAFTVLALDPTRVQTQELHLTRLPPRLCAQGPSNNAPQNLHLHHHSHHSHQPLAATTTAAAPQQFLAGAAHTQQQPLASSSTNSQESIATNETTDLAAVTPPSDDMSAGNDSQDSQLLQLSQLAAAQDKLDGPSRKRMADGTSKQPTERASPSPVRAAGHSHSRNTSSVSVASTTGSRIGEVCLPRPTSRINAGPRADTAAQLSAELKARLSYAMVKVNHGWQSNTIDEVESLATHAASPSTTSSTPTLHGPHRSSASPRLLTSASRSVASNPPLASGNKFQPQTYEPFGGERGLGKPSTSPSTVPTLAPPAPIQPSRPPPSGRRNSNPKYTPTLLSQSQPSPRTPAQPPSLHMTPNQRHMVDPILFSPHQNVREQDAIETLIFMSSPGNSANLKHSFSPTSQPEASRRHALPTSQPRKSLPSQRPPQSKRVGFQKSPGGLSAVSDMDVDMDSPRISSPHGSHLGTPRRRPNGGASLGLRNPLALPSGLAPTGKRPSVGDEDIERMLDRVAQADADSSDDEIEIPVNGRRGPAGIVGV